MHIVADIGGTKMRIARSRDLQSFDEPVTSVTPQAYEEGLKEIIDTARSLAGSEPIDSVALGFPGVLSRDRRSVLRSEHVSAWSGHALADDLETALNASVRLENDTALVGLGEACFGAGMGASIVAYITVSTGVNGARIIGGAIDRAAFGFEIGGQYLSHDGALQTLEELVSGTAVESKQGVHPRELGAEWNGWDDLARIAAIGIHNTVLHWSPDRVVLGGSMFNEIGIPVDRVAAHLASLMKKLPEIPEVVHATLHDRGGLFGGLARLRS